jgi:hypothetical protein
MGIGSIKGGLHPLIRGGGTSSSRPGGWPRMVSPVPTNAAFYFEDFYNFDFASSGNPSWLVQNITGTGTVTPGAGNQSTTAGVATVASGSTSGDVTLLCSNTRATGIAGSFGSTAVHNLAWRSSATSLSTGRQGVGFVSGTGVPLGTNWLNAPGTALATTTYAVLVRDTGVTPAGGAAGDWCLFWGDGVTDNVVPLGSAGTASSVAATWELAFNGTAYSFYKDRVLVTSFTPSVGLSGLRFDFGAQTLTGTARNIAMDFVLQEVALTVVR